jgi:hypothetical protein
MSFTFYKTSYLYEEVNCTQRSPQLVFLAFCFTNDQAICIQLELFTCQMAVSFTGLNKLACLCQLKNGLAFVQGYEYCHSEFLGHRCLSGDKKIANFFNFFLLKVLYCKTYTTVKQILRGALIG